MHRPDELMLSLPTQVAMRVNALLEHAEEFHRLKVRKLVNNEVPTIYRHLVDRSVSTATYTGGEKDKAYRLSVNLDALMADDVMAMVDNTNDTLRIHPGALEKVERRFRFCRASLTLADGTILYGNLHECELRK